MKAMILCAGLGTRLRPLTLQIPKPLLPILNKPLLEYIFYLLQDANITEIIINLHHLPEQIQSIVGSGKKYGMNVKYSYEPEILGSVGGIKNVEDFFQEETFLVINGDIIIDIDLNKVVEFHKNCRGVLTMVVKRDESRKSLYSIGYDSEDRLRQIWGQPTWFGEQLRLAVNLGVYVYEPHILNYLSAGNQIDFVKDLFPVLMERGEKIFAYETNGYWSDIGTIENYLLSGKEILALQSSLPINSKLKFFV